MPRLASGKAPPGPGRCPGGNLQFALIRLFGGHERLKLPARASKRAMTELLDGAIERADLHQIVNPLSLDADHGSYSLGTPDGVARLVVVGFRRLHQQQVVVPWC